MPNELDWFPRFGEVPGVEYSPLTPVDGKRLPGAGARPERISDRSGGRFLHWPTKGGSSSASPAHERAFGTDFSDMPTAKVLRHLAETLELPGIPSDYHFAIQGVLEALWSRRRDEPAVFDMVERLCWLDLGLVRARPDCVSYEADGEVRYYGLAAFGHLATLYEREGALREALDVAELAMHYGQLDARRDDLARRLAALEAERAG